MTGKLLFYAAMLSAYLVCGASVNIFPNGNMENQKIVYRLIGKIRGTVEYDSENAAEGKYSLKVSNFTNGNVRAYSGQIIQLNQLKAAPLSISYKGKRQGTGKTLAAVDLVITFDDNQRTYFFHGLELTGDTGGKWVEKKAVFSPDRPIKSIEVWPIVNGDVCTAWFDDIRIMTEPPAADESAVRETVIDSGNFRMTFGNYGSFFNLIELENKNGKNCFIRKSAKRIPENLWNIQFRLANNHIVSVDRGEISEISSNEAKDFYFFDWNDLAIPESQGTFSVRVTLELKGNSAQWSINVKSSEELFEIEFPQLDGIGKLGENAFDDFAVIPDKSGVLLQDYSKIGTIRLIYAAGASMQFFAFYDKNGGLYMATHDSAMLAKNYTLSHQLDNSLNYQVSVTPGAYRNYQQNFPFVMQFFKGDWFDAAQIYRNWAVQQSWCKESGLLAERKNPVTDSIHLWVKDNAISEEPYTYPIQTTAYIDHLTPEKRLKYSGKIDSEATAREIIRFSTALGHEGIAVWVTDNWHTGGCLGITPTSPEFQARNGFMEMIEILRKNGISAAPYVNFGRYDTELSSYPEEDMIRNIDGKIRTYPAHGIQQGAICHASPHASALWNELASRIAHYGCQGIYLDELSTNGNPVCYAKNHAHLAGDSTAKIKAQRANVLSLKRTASIIQKNFFTMGEQGAETYVGVNDINIWWKSSEGDEDIPLFEAVYHDYAIGLGRIPGKWYGRHMEKGYQDPGGNVGLEEFLLNLGKTFVHGLQLGIVRQDMPDYSPEAVKYLSAMVNMRHKLMDHLHYGQLIRPPKLLSPTEKLSIKQGFNGFAATPSAVILCGAFKAQNGSVATVFQNISCNAQNVVYSVSPVDGWNLENENYELTLVTPEGEENLGVVAVEKEKCCTFRLNIGPASPLAVIWRKTLLPPTGNLGEEKFSDNKLSVEVFATATQIKAGDSIYFNGKILNNTNEKHDLHLEWKIPQDWKIIRSPETVSASAKSEKPFIAEIQSNRNALPCQQEINLHIKETGEVFIFQIGQQAPRKEYSAFPAEEDVIQEIRRLTFDIDTEQNKILLVHPGKRDYEKVKSIKASGICRYDNSGLHFLFRIEGAKHTKASNTADIWKGCCMQFAFNGKRLNQPYALSLALAQTCMNNTAVWDFLEGKFIDTVKGYWKNEGTHQIYYLFIPWQKLGFTAPPVGEKISFSATYNHNDNNGFAGYLEWTKGICNGILPNEYGNLLICEAKKKQ